VTRSRAEQERARLLGAEWTGGTGDQPPEPLDAAITFAPSGDVVRAALQAVDRGATVASNAIHLDRLPEMPYEELWWERRLASVANFTRQDATELLGLAATIPIRTDVDPYPLAQADRALAALRAGQVNGAAVLLP
jgi:propanol-preferring alcohol dehydrogenase